MPREPLTFSSRMLRSTEPCAGSCWSICRQREGAIRAWHDRQIASGEEWWKQPDDHLGGGVLREEELAAHRQRSRPAVSRRPKEHVATRLGRSGLPNSRSRMLGFPSERSPRG